MEGQQPPELVPSYPLSVSRLPAFLSSRFNSTLYEYAACSESPPYRLSDSRLAAFQIKKTTTAKSTKSTKNVSLKVAKAFLRMRKMKDSGIPWIGRIPEAWDVL